MAAHDEARFRDLMQAHHYLGAAPGMGETVCYLAYHRGRWLALVVFSAPALKCATRDRWIGWQYGRLHGCLVRLGTRDEVRHVVPAAAQPTG